jgi:hypothetical protein
MRKKPAALLMRLAESDADAHSIGRFADWVRNVGPYAVVDAVTHLRRAAEDRTSDKVMRSGDSVRPRSMRRNNSAIDRAAAILRRELGFSVQEAAGLLLPMLAETVGKLPDDAAPRTKEGYVKWLTRLTKFVSPSQLLHVVTAFRNSAVHDWPLRQRMQ